MDNAMTHILIEYEKRDNTTESAQSFFRQALTKCNVDFRFLSIGNITAADLKWCDIYLAIRPFSPKSRLYARMIKKSRGFYIAFFDDDLIVHNEKRITLPWRIQCAIECLHHTDVVMGVNPLLVEEYSTLTLTKRTAVVDAIVDPECMLPADGQRDSIRFVYAASRDHDQYLSTFIMPIMNRFLARYGEIVDFTFIGVEPDLTGIENKEKLHFVPLMPYEEYNEYMRINRFDIGLSPIDDNYFTNRKYFNKYIEYTKMGIIGLYSNCLPFTQIVRHKENGLLVSNSPNCWLNAMCEAVDNAVVRAKCVHEAQREITRRFTAEKAVDTIRKTIPEIEYFERDRKAEIRFSKRPISGLFFVFADKLYKTIYQLRTSGVKRTLKTIVYSLRIHKRQ